MKMQILLLSGVLLGSSLCARDLYVSPKGNDKNPGTQNAPLATIKAAAAKAAPGDTVRLAPGIYREQVVFTKSGKKGAPITFIGTRGKKGEFLSIIEAPGATLKNWVPAPEVAPNVWKTKLPVRPDFVMMDGRMIGYINSRFMALTPWKKLPSEITGKMIMSRKKEEQIPGLTLLSLPADIRMTNIMLGKRKELFWPIMNHVFSGWSKGMLYVRFANGDKPQKHTFTATKGAGFLLQRASYLHFKDLQMRGSRMQFRIRGGSSHNLIDSCLLMHGGYRVYIDQGAKHNTVKNSILTAGFIQNKLFTVRKASDMRSSVLYVTFKYVIGPTRSDDVGVRDHGSNTKILDNIVTQGLIGLFAWGVDCEVRGNVIREMSSVGIGTGPTTVGKFYENLYENCAIPLRVHELRKERAKREEYHYRNLFVQDRSSGGQVFVHCESHRWGPDMVNFEKGTDKYKKNPPAPVDAGKIYIYHNTFWGGKEWSAQFSVRYLARRFRMTMPFFFVNNIMKGSPNMDTQSQELFNNNLLYTFLPATLTCRQYDKKVAERNRRIGVEETKKIWNTKGITGLPDLTLRNDSPALGCAIDISRPFTANGKKFAAFPGFKQGYFKGKAPAAGAFQKGESQKKFFEMHRKTEAAISMIENLSAKR